MEDILKQFLDESGSFLEASSFSPITPPNEGHDPLTPPAVFLIHWAALLGEMPEKESIESAFNSASNDSNHIIGNLRKILGADLLPSHFSKTILPFLQQYYRTGWKFSYREDFYEVFNNIEDIEDTLSLTFTDDNYARIEERLNSRWAEWHSQHNP